MNSYLVGLTLLLNVICALHLNSQICNVSHYKKLYKNAWIFSDSPDYTYEVGILRKLTSYKNNIIVIENFNPHNLYHVQFCISLTSGRAFFEERTNTFERLTNLT